MSEVADRLGEVASRMGEVARGPGEVRSADLQVSEDSLGSRPKAVVRPEGAASVHASRNVLLL